MPGAEKMKSFLFAEEMQSAKIISVLRNLGSKSKVLYNYIAEKKIMKNTQVCRNRGRAPCAPPLNPPMIFFTTVALSYLYRPLGLLDGGGGR